MTNVGLPAEARVSHAMLRQWEGEVFSGTTTLDDTDQLALEMDEAKRIVDATLRPFVEPPTVGEFLLLDQLRPAALRLVRIATQSSQPGYGKIAVYAAVPIATATNREA
jgi:hypothetical protein